jgi:hypothetical protein
MSYPKKTAFELFLDSIGYVKETEEQVVQDNIDYYLHLEKEQIEKAYDKGQENPYEYSEDNEVNYYNGEAYYHKEYVEPKLREESLAKSNKRHREIWLKSKEK